MCNFHLPPPPTPQAKQQPNLILIPFVLCTPIPLLLFVLAPPALTFLLLSIFLDLSLSVLAKWLTYFPRRKERDSRLGGRSPRFLGQWDTRENASPIFSSLVLNRHMSSGHKNVLKQLNQERKNTQEDFLDFQTNEVYFKCSFEGWIR